MKHFRFSGLIVFILLLSNLPGFSQALLPICEDDLQRISAEAESRMIDKVRSQSIWHHNMQDGRILNTRVKTSQNNYGRNGQLLETIYPNAAGETDSIIIYSYNGNKLIQRICFHPSGAVITRSVYTYNDQDYIQSVIQFQGESDIKEKDFYFYYDTMVSRVTYTPDDKLKKSFEYTKKNGFISMYKEYGKKKTPLLTYKYLRDTLNNNRISKIQITQHGEEPEISSIEHQYNTHGQLEKVIHKRANDIITKTLVYRYDEQGLPVGSARYKGEVNFHKGESDFDILDHPNINQHKQILELIKYTYEYY